MFKLWNDTSFMMITKIWDCKKKHFCNCSITGTLTINRPCN